MNILLVNDDGINAPGILKLEKILSSYGDVYVVAPSVQQSGKSSSLTAYIRIQFQKIDDHHIAVDGTPVDCVEVAHAVIDKTFDLVVSGVNNGWNLSIDSMYSGTCGACFQGSLSKVKSIAFSIEDERYFDLLDTLVPDTLQYVFEHDLLSESYYLNVNLPTRIDYKGFRITKIYEPLFEEYHIYDLNDGYYQIRKRKLNPVTKKDCDYKAVQDGYISITPLSQNTFKQTYFNELKRKTR